MVPGPPTLRPGAAVADWIADHPEWWALAMSAAAWGAMLTSHGSGMAGWMLCLPPSADGFIGNFQAAWRTGTPSALLFDWATMTVAMMPPLAVPLIRHVAVRSFFARRDRSVAAFLAGMLGIWLLAGVVALIPLAAVAHSGPNVAAVALLAAAGWQLTPMKRAALLRCHRTVPLGPIGWRADRDCLRWGAAHGLDCIGSCWAMMLAMALASHSLTISVGVVIIAMAERRARRPRLGRSALVLAAGAVLMLVSTW